MTFDRRTLPSARPTRSTTVKPYGRSFCSLVLLTLTVAVSAAFADNTHRLSVPPGFSVQELPFSVPNARQMALTDAGHLIVGTRKLGNVYLVKNALTDPSPDVVTLFDALTMPSGVAVSNGDLYIAAKDTVLKVSSIDTVDGPNPKAVIVTDALPKKSHHGWKYIKFGSDGQLYVPVGAPCNICLSDDPRFAAILRMDPDTGKSEIIAQGIRNIVGMDWHPITGDLWVSNNGRDTLGDDIPADELNVIVAGSQSLGEQAPHYGYPFEHSNDASEPPSLIDDPKFGDHERRPARTVPAALRIQAHSAPLGMAFYTDSAFPESYQGALFVAEHGSWNRSAKVGYQVTVMTETASGDREYRPFVTGWLEGESAWGRPNDVLVAPDGSLLISDDGVGRVYRVSYSPAPRLAQHTSPD